MNEKFYELPEEKQLSVLNAAMEVFAEYEYKKASTDLISAKAGVSKGLLFYYFHNKKSLYLKTYEYMVKTLHDAICDPHLFEITDFFDLITYATKKKVQILSRNPFIVNFSLRSFYSKNEEISDILKTENNHMIGENYRMYFQYIDYSKFKEGADPEHIFHMLIWMGDGYLHAQELAGKTLDLYEIDREFAQWVERFKRDAYREEFQ